MRFLADFAFVPTDCRVPLSSHPCLTLYKRNTHRSGPFLPDILTLMPMPAFPTHGYNRLLLGGFSSPGTDLGLGEVTRGCFPKMTQGICSRYDFAFLRLVTGHDQQR